MLFTAVFIEERDVWNVKGQYILYWNKQSAASAALCIYRA
jgi:hypothetical protein